jgi:cell division protein FtsI/penicillin-binding protein 2
LGYGLAAYGAILMARALDVQVLRSGPIMGQGALVLQADGARRFEYNPRFLSIIRELPKGSIYDRNGLPLATSRWAEIEAHRAEYADLGIDIDRSVSRADSRYYPLGAFTFHLLGDLRTRVRWAAPNSSFIERDSARRLRGYDDRPTVLEVNNPKTGATERTIRYDYRELVPLLRHRYEPDSPAVRRVLDRPRDVHTSIDARLQIRMAQLLERQLQQNGKQRGALVVMEAQSGDLLASVSAPAPPIAASRRADSAEDASLYLDRARYGLYPPGSTFKLVTAMAALRSNPGLAHVKYSCVRLPGDRVGAYTRGSNRPIRDDVLDKTPHGTIDMERAITVSCNAYFAQLGTYDVGAAKLLELANLFGIAAASPNTPKQLRASLAQASYGQGQVVASPFQMARVASTVASGGAMPAGRWITDESNSRAMAPVQALQPDAAALLGRYMREVVTEGTGKRARAAVEPIAGKTGTAELASAASHAWFIGFAPYGKNGKRVAFSILIENGQYGGAYAPMAAEIASTARQLGLIGDEEDRR